MSNATSSSTGAGAHPIDIAALLAEFDSSGQSAAGFARDRGIAPWKLYHALRVRSGKAKRGRASSGLAHSGLVPIRVIEEPSSHAPLELVLAGGHCLRIPSGFDEATLRRIRCVLGRC